MVRNGINFASFENFLATGFRKIFLIGGISLTYQFLSPSVAAKVTKEAIVLSLWSLLVNLFQILFSEHTLSLFFFIVGENSMPLPIRILYSIQDPSSGYASSACGVDEDDVESSSFIPCCFEMNMPSSGLLKAHDILAAFPPAGVAAEVGR